MTGTTNIRVIPDENIYNTKENATQFAHDFSLEREYLSDRVCVRINIPEFSNFCLHLSGDLIFFQRHGAKFTQSRLYNFKLN